MTELSPSTREYLDYAEKRNNWVSREILERVALLTEREDLKFRVEPTKIMLFSTKIIYGVEITSFCGAWRIRVLWSRDKTPLDVTGLENALRVATWLIHRAERKLGFEVTEHAE